MRFPIQVSRRSPALRWIAAALVSAAWVSAAVNLRSPYFLAVREPVFWIWVVAGALAAAGLSWQRRKILNQPDPIHLVALSLLFGGIVASHGGWLHFHRMCLVSAAAQMPEMGNHLITGWLGMEKTRTLAANGGIAGVFFTSRNFPTGCTIIDIRRTVDELQSVREAAGLPRLWIATDQEGGPVAKLSPPLSRQPALGKLLEDLDGADLAAQPERATEIIRRVTDYAEIQGRELAEAGINLNFAPVVDLRPSDPPGALDFHSRIATRALAADPEVVALAGETYVRILARHGITSVLKHFPGLGRVRADTHHFTTSLEVSADALEATDWLPFRQITQKTGAGVMLGHVRAASLDEDLPVSHSPAAVRFLRENWGFRGLLVTDDFSMAPISHGPGGIVHAARQSMAAGVDLILISYDAAAVYDLLGAELNDRK